jgi:hypothetical protein
LAPEGCATLTSITTGITRRRQAGSFEPGLDISVGDIKPVLSGLSGLSGFLVERNSPDEPNQPDKQNKPDRPNNDLLTLADFFSILLTVTGIYAGTDTTTCAEGYETPRVELPPVTVGRDR